MTALLALSLNGCGASDGLPREPVSGSVMFDQKPLASGNIAFYPLGPDAITQGGGRIQDGEYSIPREEGLIPGEYKVVISSSGGAQAKQVDKVESESPGRNPKLAKEAIPAQYNLQTTLTAGVTAGGDNIFPFELTRQTITAKSKSKSKSKSK